MSTGFQGVPKRGSRNLSSPHHPATLQARIKKSSQKKSIGLVLTVPAKRKFMFIRAPKKAAMPVNTPRINPTPTKTSPNATA